MPLYSNVIAKRDSHEVPCVLFEPRGGPRHCPGLIIAQHLPVAHAGLARDPFQMDVARRYAEAGYVCLMPFLFHHWPVDVPMSEKIRGFRDDWTVSDLKASLDYLGRHPSVDSSRLGILGHCWGGRIAWLGAVNDCRIVACVVFYAGRIKQSFADGGTPPINLASQMQSAFLGIFGNDDESPSISDVNDYENALIAARINYEFHRFDGAGHGFQDFNNPERYRKTQSEEAWGLSLDFLSRNL